MSRTKTIVSGWRGIALVAITYVYFLIFAQFAFLKRLAELGIADTHLKIAPIGEGLSLKARAYDALKLAILNMNIYADDAQLRLDERDLSQRFGVSRTPLRRPTACVVSNQTVCAKCR